MELLEHALYKGPKAECGKSRRNYYGVVSWDYYMKTIEADEMVYDVLINVVRKNGGNYVYDVKLVENKSSSNNPRYKF